MAAPAAARSHLERAFAPLGPMGQGVLRALDAYRADKDEAPLVAMIQSHAGLEMQPADPVPYEWQVGRFMRHCVDTRNVDGLCILARVVGPMHHGLWLTITLPRHVAAGDARSTRYAIQAALTLTLHPDKAAALQLFKDIVEVMPRAHIVAWVDFVSDLLLVSSMEFDCLYRAGDGTMPQTVELTRSEFVAKVEKSLAIGSPFPLAFDHIAKSRWAHASFDIFYIAARAFIQSDRREESHRATAHGLQWEAIGRFRSFAGTPNESVALRLATDLSHFSKLRWPTIDSNKAQTDTIQLLANHLARSRIAEPGVIPSIMDFVREAPAAAPDAYRQAELRTAREADARSYIAIAQAQVASSAPAVPPPSSSSSSSSSSAIPSRSRPDDEATDAKRRA